MLGVEERRSADHMHPTPLNERRERRVNFIFCIGAQNNGLHSQTGRRLLNITHLSIRRHKIRIDESCNGIGLWNRLVQQAKSLCFKALVELNHARQITTRTVETCYEAKSYRISRRC